MTERFDREGPAPYHSRPSGCNNSATTAQPDYIQYTTAPSNSPSISYSYSPPTERERYHYSPYQSSPSTVPIRPDQDPAAALPLPWRPEPGDPRYQDHATDLESAKYTSLYPGRREQEILGAILEKRSKKKRAEDQQRRDDHRLRADAERQAQAAELFQQQLQQQESQQLLLQQTDAYASTPEQTQWVLDPTYNRYKYYDGSKWVWAP
ncbi:hypothetical protein K458DRAFT_427482 [Lentithecium fluviatile CBS 122367]|uniref:Uncharacterized protein n=1 Tax=Lentithecium fluviatile CBS 122367 TaxID=1168545 RepID=A0A6G1JFE0_9PLEO|nr:hypothetical protein K458DRAFT_427482 [Lentithecium fluviatile CBS 122367]